MKNRMRLIVAVLAAAVAMLAVGGVAQAAWYVNKPLAQKYSAEAVKTYYTQYGLHNVRTRCRPQNNSMTDRRGSMAHRWMCAWAGYDRDGDIADGRILLAGSDGQSSYRYIVLTGIRWPFAGAQLR